MEGIQYCGGIHSVLWGDNSSTCGGIHSVLWGDNSSTCGGIASVLWGDSFSTVEVVQYSGGITNANSLKFIFFFFQKNA